MATTAEQMLINLATQLGPVQQLITGTAYLMGVSFAVRALYHMKIYGEARTMMASHTNAKEPLMYFFVAGILMFIPTGVDLMMATTFGTNNILAYSEWPSTNPIGLGGRAILYLVQVIGLIAFIRGWLYMAKSQQQGAQGGFGKGLTHVFGGLLAMNIVGTATMISNTLGVTLP